MVIITATKTEAQAIVERCNLKKETKNGYNFYKNDDILVFVCGVGIEKSYKGCLFLKENINLNGKKIINIGIAAAPKKFNIGDVVDISKIVYKDKVIDLKTKGEVLECVDRPVYDEKDTLIDMESYGIYKALSEFEISFKKIVSDHFQPDTISKDFVKKLIKSSLIHLQN